MDFDEQLKKIVLRCQASEKAAFEELFEIYQPRLKYYIRRLDGDSCADDMLQDIWLTVFKKIYKLKSAEAFAVWLYRIARNKVYSGFRRKERFLSLPEDKAEQYSSAFLNWGEIYTQRFSFKNWISFCLSQCSTLCNGVCLI